MKIQIKSFWPAALGLIVATLLFCLPGKEFPEVGWLEKIQLDKFIHIGLFFVLVVLWCLPMHVRMPNRSRVSLYVTIAFVVYGIAIEFIQRDFIPNRSFDVFDIVADTIGCIAGWVLVEKYR